MNLREAAQQALEALENLDEQELATGDLMWLGKEIGDLRAALAEPVQEPIGYLWPTGRHPEFRFTQQKRDGVDGTPVYTAPPPPQRKPLSKSLLEEMAEKHVTHCYFDTLTYARAIERAHGIGGEE